MKLTETRLRQIIREELIRESVYDPEAIKADEDAIRKHLGISSRDAAIMTANKEMQGKHDGRVYSVSLYDQYGFNLPSAFYSVNDDGSVKLIFKSRY